LTTENIAVFVAMPSARAAIAAMVKPGVRRNMRPVCFKSFRNASMTYSDESINITSNYEKHESESVDRRAGRNPGRVGNWRGKSVGGSLAVSGVSPCVPV
jgi:hypothetical protein